MMVHSFGSKLKETGIQTKFTWTPAPSLVPVVPPALIATPVVVPSSTPVKKSEPKAQNHAQAQSLPKTPEFLAKKNQTVAAPAAAAQVVAAVTTVPFKFTRVPRTWELVTVALCIFGAVVLLRYSAIHPPVVQAPVAALAPVAPPAPLVIEKQVEVAPPAVVQQPPTAPVVVAAEEPKALPVPAEGHPAGNLAVAVMAENVVLRSGPGTEFRKLGVVHAEMKMNVKQWKADWFEVELPEMLFDTNSAWVRGDLVKVMKR